MNLASAKQYLRRNFEKGVTCPACGQFVKRYPRRLNAAIARNAIIIYRWFDEHPERGVIDINEELRKLQINSSSSNAALLQYWGILEPVGGRREDGSKRVGLYRPTATGRKFVRGEIRLPTYIYMYNQQILDRPTDDARANETTTVFEALGKRFNYAELMGWDDDE